MTPNDEPGFNGSDRQMLRRLETNFFDFKLQIAERLTALETKVDHLDSTLATKVGKESFAPVKWLIYTIVAAAIAITVGAVLQGGHLTGGGRSGV